MLQFKIIFKTAVNCISFFVQKKPWKSTTDCQFAQSEQPWDRLYKVQTLASKRRQYHYFDPQSPLDKLDFNIKTVYNQHTDVFVDCNMAVCQLETTENEDVHKLVLNSTDELKLIYFKN